jgi:hypothetical protein
MFSPLRFPSLLVIMLSFCIGCAPATVQGLRENSSGKYVFEINQNYQAIYRTILVQSRNCFQGSGLLGMADVVQGDLYNDIKAGNISIAHHNPMYGINTWIAIDISALDNNATKVETYYAISTWAPVAQAVEQWVKNGSKECRFSQ